MSRRDRTGGLRRIWIVARREIRERGGTRAFQLTTALVVLVIAAGIILPSKLGGGSERYELGLAGRVPVGSAQALTAQAKAIDRQLTTTSYSSIADGEQAVRDRDVDALLVDGTQLEWRRATDNELAALVTNAMQVVTVRARAQELGISDEQLGQLLVPAPLSNRRIGTARTADVEAQTIATLAIMMLLIALSLYGSFVLTGVVQEKSNRVAEVLLARMPPREVLAGKVLGIGALGLGQFALFAATAGISVQVLGEADAPDVSTGLLAWLVLWFVLGFAFYSVVYAGLGALTSRLEDAQSVSTPVSMLLVAGFWGTLFAQDNPESWVTTLLSFLPVTSVFAMPMRLAIDAAPAWQAAASAVLTLVAAVLLIRVAGRVYTGALLRTGRRVSLRDAWRSAAA